MKEFVVPGQTPQQFVTKAQEALKGRKLGEIVSIDVEGTNILLTFSKLGKSEIRLGTTADPASGGFKASVKDEKIAFAHKLARGDIEAKLMKVIQDIGAKVG